MDMSLTQGATWKPSAEVDAFYSQLLGMSSQRVEAANANRQIGFVHSSYLFSLSFCFQQNRTSLRRVLRVHQF
jgi:hypothetical protein